MLGLALIATLGCIAYQDFRNRAVWWWLFPLAAIPACWMSIQALTWYGWLDHVLNNALFIGIQIGVVTLYFSMKYRRLVNIFHSQLGLGDVLLFAVLALLLPTLHFIFFFLASALGAMLASLVYWWPRKKTIPLAGVQSILLLLLLVGSYFLQAINLFDQSWLHRMLF